ncbi:unnamed protein product, partial [Vitis vinifera]
MLCSTTVSMVKPGPKPNNTPQSNPSPVVAFSPFNDFLLISSKINNTHALDMLPYSLNTCLVASSFFLSKLSFASTASRIAGPPG